MRASNLNELIYKQGQAGVTKASVTLVFDNSNAELSPHGYDHYKKITVTRQVRHRHPESPRQNFCLLCMSLEAVPLVIATTAPPEGG